MLLQAENNDKTPALAVFVLIPEPQITLFSEIISIKAIALASDPVLKECSLK